MVHQKKKKQIIKKGKTQPKIQVRPKVSAASFCCATDLYSFFPYDFFFIFFNLIQKTFAKLLVKIWKRLGGAGLMKNAKGKDLKRKKEMHLRRITLSCTNLWVVRKNKW